MANILKKAVGSLMESMFSSGTVTAVRAWPATMFEVDVRLPSVSMEKWNSIKRLKCQVGLLEYRDYTPACWNATTNLCTLFIEAGHEGAGSFWVKNLKPGDELLFGPAHAAQLPAQKGRILCLGDGSALGHFLALQQLTDAAQYPMDTGIYLPDKYEIPESFAELNCGFELLMKPHTSSIEVLEQWLLKKGLSSYTSIYIAGQISMASGLRKILKAMPAVQARIYTHGFWS